MTECYHLTEAQYAERREELAADMIAAQVIKGREMIERQKAEALAIERKAFIRAFVIENSVALQDHDVLAIAVKHWDDIKERA